MCYKVPICRPWETAVHGDNQQSAGEAAISSVWSVWASRPRAAALAFKVKTQGLRDVAWAPLAKPCHESIRRPNKAGLTSRLRPAFTLVELMVVIVIIGLLASAVTMSIRSYLIRGKQSVAKMEIAKICQALDTFYAENDRYPTNDEGIELLVENSDQFPDGLLAKMPVDPWGNAYQYNHPGADAPYDVISYGADGREAGEAADRDISSANLDE